MTIDVATREEMATSAETFLRGKLSDKETDVTVDAVRSLTLPSYPAQGAVICAIFYWRVSLDCHSAGKTFTGNGGGVGSLGAGSTNGDIYTADLPKLVAETASFQFNCIPVALNVNFFNGNSELLGVYAGGGVGICTGVGGGSGSWG